VTIDCLFIVYGLFDFVTDLLYLVTTPMYNKVIMLSLLVTFCATPFFFLMRFVLNERKRSWPVQFVYVCSSFFRIRNWLERNLDLHTDYMRSHLGVIFCCLESTPQLILQVLNNMYLGQTLTIIQCVSPLTSLLIITSSIFSILHVTQLKQVEMRVQCYQFIYAVFPLPLVVLLVFVGCALGWCREPGHTGWIASNFSTVRWEHIEGQWN
jgi:hypothetical protein